MTTEAESLKKQIEYLISLLGHEDTSILPDRADALRFSFKRFCEVLKI